MSTYQKSVALWVGGAIAGALLVPSAKIKTSRIAGAAMGAIVVGGIGDAVLERAECERR